MLAHSVTFFLRWRLAVAQHKAAGGGAKNSNTVAQHQVLFVHHDNIIYTHLALSSNAFPYLYWSSYMLYTPRARQRQASKRARSQLCAFKRAFSTETPPPRLLVC